VVQGPHRNLGKARILQAVGATPVKLETLPTVPNPGQVTDLHFSVVG
jgi:hypothetical protein